MFDPDPSPRAEDDERQISGGEPTANDPHAAEAGQSDAQPPWQQIRQEWVDRFATWLDIAAETEAGRELLREMEQARGDQAGFTGGGLPSGGDLLRGRLGATTAGLLDVVGSLTALRHELKLQTKSARTLVDRVGADADRFQENAARIVQSVERLPDVDVAQLTLPLVDSLVDTDEAVGRLREAIASLAADYPAAPPAPPRVSWWSRRSVAAAEAAVAEVWTKHHRSLTGLAEGVRLLSSRLDDHLAENRIQRVGRVGESIDPHTMQVLEVVIGSGAAAGTVARVLRPGYRCGNRVIRPAQVAAEKA